MRVHYITDVGRKPQIGDLVVGNNGEVAQVDMAPFVRHVDPELAEEARKAVVWSEAGGVAPLKRVVEWQRRNGDEFWATVNSMPFFQIMRQDEIEDYSYHVNQCFVPLTYSNGEFDGVWGVFGNFEVLRLLCEAEINAWLKGI